MCPSVAPGRRKASLGYLYSTSFAAPHLFGDRVGQFENAVMTALAEFSDNGVFLENNEFLIRIGRRSGI